MMKVRSKAKEFLKKEGITQFPITDSQLQSILERNNWPLVPYAKAESIFKQKNFEEYRYRYSGFSYRENGETTIFVDNSLGCTQITSIIFHEIGHDVLNHTNKNGVLGKARTSSLQNIIEQEADTFALEVQYPLSYIDKQKISSALELQEKSMLSYKDAHTQYSAYLDCKNRLWLISCFKLIKKYWILILLSICLLTACALFLFNTNHIAKTSSEHMQTIQSNSSTKYVYTTRTGTKYHLSTCHYVKNKSNINKFTKQEATSGGYSPCSICNP